MTSSDVQVWRFGGRELRRCAATAERAEGVAVADLCVLIEHSNPTMAVRDNLDDDQWFVVDHSEVIVAGRADTKHASSRPGHGAQSLTMVTEDGAFALIASMRTDRARQVRRWLVSALRAQNVALTAENAALRAAERDRERLADLVAGVSELLRRGQWRNSEARGIEIVAGNEQRRLTAAERRKVGELRHDAAIDAFAAANSLGFAREQWSAWCSPSGAAALESALPEHGGRVRPPSSATTLLSLGDGDGSTPGELGS